LGRIARYREVRNVHSAKKQTSGSLALELHRQIIEADLMAGKYARRKVERQARLRALARQRAARSAKIRTRFPPEPNGYLHYGHAKSICLNFGLARDYGGACHLRFRRHQSAKEETELRRIGVVEAQVGRRRRSRARDRS